MSERKSEISMHVETVEPLALEGADILITDAIPGDDIKRNIRVRLHERAQPTKYFLNFGIGDAQHPPPQPIEYFYFELLRGGEVLPPRTLIPINPGFYDDVVVHLQVFKVFSEGKVLKVKLKVQDESELEKVLLEREKAGLSEEDWV